RSLGKFIFGVVVIDLETGMPGGWRQSAGRNILFVLPGANLIAVFRETATLLRDPQGLRLGDRFAMTQVVDGLGAKDLLTQIQEQFVASLKANEIESQVPVRVPIRMTFPGCDEI